MALSTTPSYCCTPGGEYSSAIPMLAQNSLKSLLVQRASQSQRMHLIAAPALWAASATMRLTTARAPDLRRMA
ncbi:unnamed protein product [Ectocarpus sp. CCAP 1310/34]|nr:unnamed protein product [Ectocarpus sp. CCAP 1310/34]